MNSWGDAWGNSWADAWGYDGSPFVPPTEVAFAVLHDEGVVTIATITFLNDLS